MGSVRGLFWMMCGEGVCVPEEGLGVTAIGRLLHTRGSKALDFKSCALTSGAGGSKFRFGKSLCGMGAFTRVAGLRGGKVFICRSIPKDAMRGFGRASARIRFAISTPRSMRFALRLRPRDRCRMFVTKRSTNGVKAGLDKGLDMDIRLGTSRDTTVGIIGYWSIEFK